MVSFIYCKLYTNGRDVNTGVSMTFHGDVIRHNPICRELPSHPQAPDGPPLVLQAGQSNSLGYDVQVFLFGLLKVAGDCLCYILREITIWNIPRICSDFLQAGYTHLSCALKIMILEVIASWCQRYYMFWYDTLLLEISKIFTSSQMGGGDRSQPSQIQPNSQLTSTQSRVFCQGMSPSCWILLPFWVAQPRLMRHRRRCRRTPCSARISRWLGLEDVDGLWTGEFGPKEWVEWEFGHEKVIEGVVLILRAQLT